MCPRDDDRFGLGAWSVMIQSVSSAISNPNNQFRILAPVLIKEVKQAQEQVLAQKANQIKVSAQLLRLIPSELSYQAAKLTKSQSSPSLAGNSLSDEMSDIFGAVIEEDKAMKGWQTFSDQVGWRKNGTWIGSNSVHPQTPPPDGHFPTPLWLAAWHQSKDTKAKEFQSQYATLLAKIASCNLS